uniref:Glycoside hydrolase family 5 n=1 Tax=uncultured bacterium contig00133 TaxID=1181582 RepID=A0A806KBB9_9BACT|nr:glycoside hydrolase family 5 [uncultured bacterium contig00133]
MKNFFKLQSFIIAIIIAIGFSFGGCASGNSGKATVVKVAIVPAGISIIKGESWAFIAQVVGAGDPAKTVTWSIEQDNTASGTSIDSEGRLTVAADESLENITIKAVSTVDKTKSASASVTIITNPAFTEKQPFNDITASQLVAGIKIGWNLGNTLDASGMGWLGANPSIVQMETGWIGGVTRATRKENFEALKNGGFNAVRIPVSWNKVVDKEYNIRPDWMARVTEIVNYAVETDLYILLNTHHDEDIFKFTDSRKDESLKAFGTIWRQIAENFKNYNEKLVFEALNEPRTKGSSAEWSGGTAAEHAILNEHYRLFVDTVRKTGGNNDKRILMVNTYAASAEAAAINGLEIPNDTVPDKIIASIHAYAPYNFALNTGGGSTPNWSVSNPNDTSPITNALDRAREKFINNGIPVIMGEFGAMDRKNEETRAAWAKFYVSEAKKRGIPCFWWDNYGFGPGGEIFGLLDRATNTFRFPLLLEGLMEGAGVR